MTWDCPLCTLRNVDKKPRCGACGNRRPLGNASKSKRSCAQIIKDAAGSDGDVHLATTRSDLHDPCNWDSQEDGHNHKQSGVGKEAAPTAHSKRKRRRSRAEQEVTQLTQSGSEAGSDQDHHVAANAPLHIESTEACNQAQSARNEQAEAAFVPSVPLLLASHPRDDARQKRKPSVVDEWLHRRQARRKRESQHSQHPPSQQQRGCPVVLETNVSGINIATTTATTINNNNNSCGKNHGNSNDSIKAVRPLNQFAVKSLPSLQSSLRAQEKLATDMGEQDHQPSEMGLDDSAREVPADGNAPCTDDKPASSSELPMRTQAAPETIAMATSAATITPTTTPASPMAPAQQRGNVRAMQQTQSESSAPHFRSVMVSIVYGRTPSPTDQAEADGTQGSASSGKSKKSRGKKRRYKPLEALVALPLGIRPAPVESAEPKKQKMSSEDRAAATNSVATVPECAVQPQPEQHQNDAAIMCNRTNNTATDDAHQARDVSDAPHPEGATEQKDANGAAAGDQHSMQEEDVNASQSTAESFDYSVPGSLAGSQIIVSEPSDDGEVMDAESTAAAANVAADYDGDGGGDSSSLPDTPKRCNTTKHLAEMRGSHHALVPNNKESADRPRDANSKTNNDDTNRVQTAHDDHVRKLDINQCFDYEDSDSFAASESQDLVPNTRNANESAKMAPVSTPRLSTTATNSNTAASTTAQQSAPQTNSAETVVTMFTSAGSKTPITVSSKDLAKAQSLLGGVSIHDADGKSAVGNNKTTGSDQARNQAPRNATTAKATPHSLSPQKQPLSGRGMNGQLARRTLRKPTGLNLARPPASIDTQRVSTPSLPTTPMSTAASSAAMFTTAGSKSVIAVSEDAMKRAKQMFQATAADHPPQRDDDGFAARSKSSPSFQSTTGKQKGLLRQPHPRRPVAAASPTLKSTLARRRPSFTVPRRKLHTPKANGSLRVATASQVTPSSTIKTNSDETASTSHSPSPKMGASATLSNSPGSKKFQFTTPAVSLAGIKRPIMVTEEDAKRAKHQPFQYDSDSDADNNLAAGHLRETARRGDGQAESKDGDGNANKAKQDGQRLQTSETDNGLAMFSTAGQNKPIRVSAEGMARAKQLLASGADSKVMSPSANSNRGERDQAVAAIATSPVPSERETGIALFSTAGNNRPIHVTEESLRRAQMMFASSSAPTLTPTNGVAGTRSTAKPLSRAPPRPKPSLARIAPTPRVAPDPTKSKSSSRTLPTASAIFTTAGRNRPIQVSEASLMKAKMILGVVKPPSPQSSAVKLTSTTGGAPGAAPGSTNTNTNTKPPATNSTRNQTSTPFKPPQVPVSTSTNISATPAALFATTGSSKPIHVSKEAMAKAHSLLGGCTAAGLAGAVARPTRTSSPTPTTRNSLATNRSAGKAVIPTMPTPRTAQTIDGGIARNTSDAADQRATPTSALFTTAGRNKAIHVSKDALLKAKKLFSDGLAAKSLFVPSSLSSSSSFQKSTPRPETPGAALSFSPSSTPTAAQLGTNKASSAMTTAPSATTPATTPGGFNHTAMFSTAGKGIAITVSEESLRKAKQLLHSTGTSTTAAAVAESTSLQQRGNEQPSRALDVSKRTQPQKTNGLGYTSKPPLAQSPTASVRTHPSAEAFSFSYTPTSEPPKQIDNRPPMPSDTLASVLRSKTDYSPWAERKNETTVRTQQPTTQIDGTLKHRSNEHQPASAFGDSKQPATPADVSTDASAARLLTYENDQDVKRYESKNVQDVGARSEHDVTAKDIPIKSMTTPTAAPYKRTALGMVQSGFVLAGSGRGIDVSADSLRKASGLLDVGQGDDHRSATSDLSFNNSTRKDKSTHAVNKEAEPSPLSCTTHNGTKTKAAFSGFATAGRNTKIQVSEEARKRAARLFGDETKSVPGTTLMPSVRREPDTMKETASTCRNKTPTTPSVLPLAQETPHFEYDATLGLAIRSIAQGLTQQTPGFSPLEPRHPARCFDGASQDIGAPGCAAETPIASSGPTAPNAIVSKRPSGRDGISTRSPRTLLSQEFAASKSDAVATPANRIYINTNRSNGDDDDDDDDAMDVDNREGRRGSGKIIGSFTHKGNQAFGTMPQLKRDMKYGIMTSTNSERSLHGVQNVTLSVNSTNAMHVLFDKTSGLPSCIEDPDAGDASVDKNANADDTADGAASRIGTFADIRHRLHGMGCTSKLMTDKWILTHKRWVVWKLSSTERQFSRHLAGRYFTYDTLVQQLAKRYRKEVRDGKRSALRKVLNCDAAASRMMILCVSQVFSSPAISPAVGSSSLTSDKQAGGAKDFAPSAAARGMDGKAGDRMKYKLELSDGWYGVQASLDTKLNTYVRDGRIQVGTKLLVSSAVLAGSDDGIDPLDEGYDSSSPKCTIGLMICANSTRLARWDAKLGFVRISQRQYRSTKGKLCIKRINDIIMGGGNIPAITLRVVKVYPRQYLEKVEGSASAPMILTEAMEESRQQEFEKRRQRAMEKISDQIEQEVEADVDEMAPEVWHKLTSSMCPEDFYSGLSDEDRHEVDRWKDKRGGILQDRIKKEVEAELEVDTSLERSSTPFMRVLVTSHGCGTTDVKADGRALLTIWKPSEEHMERMKDGHCILALGLSVRDTKYDGKIQLTANSRTRMEMVSSKPKSMSKSTFGASSDRSSGLRDWCHQQSFLQHLQRNDDGDVQDGCPHQSLLRVHVQCRRWAIRCNQRNFARRHPQCVDTIGVIFTMTQDTMYITDESMLILRIRTDGAALRVAVGDAVAFNDLDLSACDDDENCACASYSIKSSFSKASECSTRLQMLRTWAASEAGQASMRRATCLLEAKIGARACVNQTTAIGYVSSLRFDSDASSSQVQVEVECGPNGIIDRWRLPVKLLKVMQSHCLQHQKKWQQSNQLRSRCTHGDAAAGGGDGFDGDGHNIDDNGDECSKDGIDRVGNRVDDSNKDNAVAATGWVRLSDEEEARASGLGETLGPIFRQRGLLWRFQLRATPRNRGYMVHAIEPADVASLANAILSAFPQT